MVTFHKCNIFFYFFFNFVILVLCAVDFEVPPTLNGRRPFVTGSILHSKYEAVGVHFHWGSTNSKGSEHMIDDRRFDVEMHIVHKNVLYPTLEEAIKHVDGLTVLGVMFKGTKVSLFVTGFCKNTSMSFNFLGR